VRTVLRHADLADKAEIYAQLGLRLIWHPTGRTVRAQATRQPRAALAIRERRRGRAHPVTLTLSARALRTLADVELDLLRFPQDAASTAMKPQLLSPLNHFTVPRECGWGEYPGTVATGVQGSPGAGQ
jgi:hypothetical protein